MDASLDNLWNLTSASTGVFSWRHTARQPDSARRFLEHAIASDTPLASAVRLRMHGEIKLGRWLPFHAEQVIRADHGFIWAATVRLLGVPIFRGFDRLIDGVGAMRWKLFGLLPVMTASGPDISRSAVGRVTAESVWLPSVLAREDVQWTARDWQQAAFRFSGAPESDTVECEMDGSGRLRSLKMQRWGNPDGGTFRLVDFGGVMEEEGTFGGYTIPTRVRIGWFFGSDRFERDGEFFRAAIDEATFR